MCGGINNVQLTQTKEMKNLNKPLTRLAMFFLLTCFAVACNYEEKDLLDGKGARIVRMNIEGPLGLVAFDAVKQKRGVVTLNRDAISNSELNSSVSVDLAFDPAILTAYNDTLTSYSTDQGLGPYTLLPANSYTAINVSSGKFTFNAGEAVNEVVIELDPSKLDFSEAYALPISIGNPTGGYKIGVGKNVVLQHIIVKNQYDGTYQSDGTRYNFGAQGDYAGWNSATNTPNGTIVSSAPWSGTTVCSTRGAATINVHVGQFLDGGLGFFNVTVNGDNTLTIASSGETDVTNLQALPGKTSTYNPATKTFEIWYQWLNAAGTFRVNYVKLVRK